jgi:hypothetical protein
MADTKNKTAKKGSKRKPKYLEANGLVIKDMKGKVRASIDTSEKVKGWVALNLYGDPDSQVAISAGPDGHAGMDVFYNNKTALSIGATREGTGIQLCDELGRPSFFIVAGNQKGSGRIRIYQDGKLIWKTS